MINYKTYIKEEIRKKLLNGEFLYNRPLPSTRNLAYIFQSCPATIATALRELAAEGLLYKTPSKKFFPDTPESKIKCTIRKIIAIGTDCFGDNDKYYQPFLNTLEKECKKRKKDFEFHRIKGLNLRLSVNSDFRVSLYSPSIGVVVLAPLYPHDIGFLSRSGIPFVVLNNYYATESICIVIDEKQVTSMFINTAEKYGHNAVGIINVGKHKQGNTSQILPKELKKQCLKRGIIFNEQDSLIIEKIDPEYAGKKLKSFFSKQHEATIFLVAGDDLSCVVKEVTETNVSGKKMEFVNFSDGDTQIFPLNICKPSAEQAKLGISFLLEEELPERKIHYVPPVLKKTMRGRLCRQKN